MYPVFRFGRVVGRAFFRPRLHPLDESVLRLRVWPSDLDYNLHLNNGRYLTLMDLGRLDLLIRVGALPAMRRNRWGAVVASLAIRYRRPLSPFQPFELCTRALGWDERWFFLEQRIRSGDELIARCVVKTLFVAGKRRIAPAEFVAATGRKVESPPIPDSIRAWEAAEDALQEAQDRAA
jgi:acyl-CoA thioesterase FadM